MRKPREFSGYGPYSHCDQIDGHPHYARYKVWVGNIMLSVKQLRAFAAWLLKAADWLEEKEGK